jgi:hypothetical protein
MMRRTRTRPVRLQNRIGGAVSACVTLLLALGTHGSAAGCSPDVAPSATQYVAFSESDPVQPALRTRIYVGMWTSHVRDPARGVDANSLLGVAWRGWFGGTFINSYGDRAVSAGLQRNFTRTADKSLTASVGYRAGVVTGYDERFLPLAERTPVMPFAQLIGAIDHRKIGAELAYAGLTASVIVSWKL